MSFGASTRLYTLREKPQSQPNATAGDSKGVEDEELKGLLGLPEEETDLEVRWLGKAVDVKLGVKRPNCQLVCWCDLGGMK